MDKKKRGKGQITGKGKTNQEKEVRSKDVNDRKKEKAR